MYVFSSVSREHGIGDEWVNLGGGIGTDNHYLSHVSQKGTFPSDWETPSVEAIQGRSAGRGAKDAKRIRIPGKLIQGIPLCRGLPLIHLTHETPWNIFPNHPISRCMLVMWVAIQLNKDQLFWQWCGSIYSWKHCRMEPVSNLDESSQNMIKQMITPITRGWSRFTTEFKAGPSAPGSASPFGPAIFGSNIEL